MTLIATIAVIAAMLTGPFPDGAVTSSDLPAPGETVAPRVAQNEREVHPSPLPTSQDSDDPIAAFWIILPD